MKVLNILMNEYRLPLGILILALGVLLTLLALWSYPYDVNKDYSDRPLGSLEGFNMVVAIFGMVVLVVGLYIVSKYFADRRKFYSLINTNSQALFKRNQLELERLALRLSKTEEKLVLEAMKRFRIK
jgi:hypothetical protein